MELRSPQSHTSYRLWQLAILIATAMMLLFLCALSGGLNSDAPSPSPLETMRGPLLSPNLDWPSLQTGGSIALSLIIIGLWILFWATIQTVGRLKFRRIRFLVEKTPQRLRDDWRIGHWREDLEEWGFSTLGVMSEESLDGNRAQSLNLGSTAGKAFASAVLLQGQLLYHFYTPFQPTGLLLTSNAPFPRVQTPDCQVYVQRRTTLPALWKFHQQRLRDLVNTGLMPETDYGPESRLKAAQAFYTHPAVQRSVKRSFCKQVGAIAAVFFLPEMLIGVYLIIQAGILLPPVERLGWQTYRAPDNTFEVAVPQAPSQETREGQQRFWTQANGFSYEIAYTELSPAARDQATAKILETYQNALIPPGSTLIFARDIDRDGSTGRAFQFRTANDQRKATVVEGRLYLAGPRLYQVIITYGMLRSQEPSIDLFLNSFRLLNPIHSRVL